MSDLLPGEFAPESGVQVIGDDTISGSLSNLVGKALMVMPGITSPVLLNSLATGAEQKISWTSLCWGGALLVGVGSLIAFHLLFPPDLGPLDSKGPNPK